MAGDAEQPRKGSETDTVSVSVEGTTRSAAPAERPVPGTYLGPFRIEARIGEGGLGIVYRAYDDKLKRPVALKVLVEGPAGGGRLLAEARAAAALTHPNIAAIYDVEHQDGITFIVMELVEGEPLRAEIRRGAVAPDVALRRAIDVASGLARAHKGGVVHRDLKPENLMVTPDGGVKILDFGLARDAVEPHLAADDGPPSSVTGVVGTPDYMAPEQGLGRRVDARADVFSFGVVLFEMLTGERPFAPVRSRRSVERHVAGPGEPSIAERLATLAPKAPRELALLVERCLQHDASGRFTDGSELLTALRALATGPVAAAPARWTKWVPIGLAAATAVLLGAFAFVDRRSPTPAAPIAASASAVASVTPRPLAITDLPVPASSAPAATEGYVAALKAEREGNASAARRALRKAVAADPDMGAAWLRLALALFFYDDTKGARDAMGHVGPLSARLDEHDRALFDAATPLILQDPADWAEYVRRLRAASGRFPGDVELATSLAHALTYDGQWSDAIVAYDRARALDPQSADAYVSRSQAQAMLGDLPGALATADACEKSVPASTDCIDARVRIHEQAGDCAALEADGRAQALRDASSGGYGVVAEALAAQGRSPDTVREAIDLFIANVDPHYRDLMGTLYGLLFAMWRGDFAAGESGLRHLEALGKGDAREEVQGVPLMLLSFLYEEEGRLDDARRTAAKYLERQPTWLAYKRYTGEGLVFSPMPTLLAMARTPATADALDRRREAWARDWADHLEPAARSAVWLAAYAAPSHTPADAKRALDALPDFQPLPVHNPDTTWLGSEGKVYLLAGDAAHAEPLLERGARVCISLHDPFAAPRARLDLGTAREALGDVPGACAAYAAVIARWGKATPRSVTAEAAANRAAALRCAPL